ncbi:hypothetical protein KR084_010414 [Drosophila pseudotakahashii]|nr:hypothetical protein KR084_010414 [Drosophila pseudotakahashii]
MYTVEQINGLLCYLLRTYLRINTARCEFYSIWRSPLTMSEILLRDFLAAYVFTCQEVFPFTFYYSLAISVLGVLHNLIEFIDLCSEKMGIHLVRMWQPRKLAIFKDIQLRRYRIVGSVFMFKAWSLLLYALVYVKPQYIRPWLMISAIALFIDVFFLLVDVLLHRRMCSLRSLLPFSFPLINMLCVLCVKTSFERIIKEYGAQDLAW